jgi:hypothetical protein
MRAIGLLALLQLKNAFRTTFTDFRKLLPLLFFGLLWAAQLTITSLLQGLRAPVREQMADFLLANLPTVQSATFLILILIAVGNLDFGFSTGFLHFTMADIDYLFPSPIPPRAILAYRLASKTVVTFFQAAFLFLFFFWFPIEAVADGQASWSGGGSALLALFFCLGGYANLALWLKLAFGGGKLTRLRPVILAVVTLFGVYLMYSYWELGLEGLLRVSRSQTAALLFYPCRLAADAMVAPLMKGVAPVALGWLGGFYVVTLLMVFARREHFYEASLEGSEQAAKLLQAARELNWAALMSGGAVGASGGRTASYTAPVPKGRAWTLFWAHMASAARRPVANVAIPLVGGILLTVAAQLAFKERLAAVMVGALGGYLLFVFTIAGITTFRQALARQPLVRPLPLRDWQVVISDVAPRVLLLSLFAWSAGFSVLLGGGRGAARVALIMVVHAPAALVPLNLIQYVLALWYPNSQDKIHQLVAGLIGVFVTGLAAGFMIPLALAPMAMRLPWWISAAIFVGPCAFAALVLLALAVWLYGRYEP